MKKTHGFSLIEMAIVLVVIGLLVGTILLPLSEQMESARRSETSTQMSEIKEALLGFAIANGRLPCPSTLASDGQEAPYGGGNCTQPNGFIPYKTLGITGTFNTDNLFNDSWGNPIGYTISVRDTNFNGIYDYTSSREMQNVINDISLQDASSQQLGIHALSVTYQEAFGWPSNPCTSNGNTNCNDLEIYNDVAAGKIAYSTSAPAVIYSLGPDWAEYYIGGTGLPSTFEVENIGATYTATRAYRLSNNTVFVKRTTSTQAGNQYDDVVEWISKNILISKLLAAGQITPP